MSVDGGLSPAWNPSGREIFFLTPRSLTGTRRMMSVTFTPGASPVVGRPTELFEYAAGEFNLFCTPVRCLDVADDGQRFYAVQWANQQPRPPVTHINLILNWFEELKEKVPLRR